MDAFARSVSLGTSRVATNREAAAAAAMASGKRNRHELAAAKSGSAKSMFVNPWEKPLTYVPK